MVDMHDPYDTPQRLIQPLFQAFMMHVSSRPDVFSKKGVIENFAKFTEKHQCQSLFLNKVTGVRPA